MNIFKKILLISRPRIWIYTIGMFWIGVTIGTHDPLAIFKGFFLPLSLYLTLPINIFIYAINDVFDVETDKYNPKKDGFEFAAQKKDKLFLLYLAVVFLLPLPFIIIHMPTKVWILVSIWLFLVVSYNFPPLRWKAVPILDLLFAFNFPIWAMIGYLLSTGQLPQLFFIYIGVIFSIIMHLYTSSLDIDYDKKTNIHTTATLFNTLHNNLLICFILSVLTSVFLFVAGVYIVSIWFLMYGVFFFINMIFERYFLSKLLISKQLQ